MDMKGYSYEFNGEEYASARLEDVNASYKDLSEVCGVVRNRKSGWALDFLEKAAKGEVPVFFRRHNKRLGHRRALGGKKGRYPKKSAAFILKTLKSAIANAEVKGLSGDFLIVHASANKKNIYPRMAPKGRMARSFLETSRIELVLKALDVVPAGVEVRAPGSRAAAEKKAEPKDSSSKVKKSEESAKKTDESAKKPDNSGKKEPEAKEKKTEKDGKNAKEPRQISTGRAEDLKEKATDPVKSPPGASGDAPPENAYTDPKKKEEKKALEEETK
jgi:large subunit ribosomal protein L22